MELILRVDLTKYPIEVFKSPEYYFEKKFPFYLPSISPKDVKIVEDVLIFETLPNKKAVLPTLIRNPIAIYPSYVGFFSKVLVLHPDGRLIESAIDDPKLLEGSPLIKQPLMYYTEENHQQKLCWKCQLYGKKSYSDNHRDLSCPFKRRPCFYCSYIEAYKSNSLIPLSFDQIHKSTCPFVHH